MIHILLLILKIVGLILLSLLGLLLVLLLVILLTPFRCTLEASIDNSLRSARGRLRFHWLFHLISGEAAWLDGELTWRFRAAWKNFSSADEPEPESEFKPESSAGQPGDKPEPEKNTEPEVPDRPTVSETASAEEKAPEPEINAVTESPAVPEQVKKAGDRDGARRTSRIQALLDRIKSTFKRIKYTFRRLCDNIKALNNKKERLSRFLSNDIHQKAFSRLIRETRGLLRRLRPSRAAVNITFGFEDPSYTGYTLAGISLIYPVIGEYTNLTPDFEHKVLKGDLFIGEKIRLVYAVILAWNMVIDRNVRTTYRHLRKFKW